MEVSKAVDMSPYLIDCSHCLDQFLLKQLQYPGTGYFILSTLLLFHGIVANVMVVIGINNMKPATKSKPYYRYMISLALARVFTGVVGILLEILMIYKSSYDSVIYSTLFLTSVFGLHRDLLFCCFMLGLLSLLAIAVDNLTASVKPYHYFLILRKKTVNRSIVLLWIAGLMLGLTPFALNTGTTPSNDLPHLNDTNCLLLNPSTNSTGMLESKMIEIVKPCVFANRSAYDQSFQSYKRCLIIDTHQNELWMSDVALRECTPVEDLSYIANTRYFLQTSRFYQIEMISYCVLTGCITLFMVTAYGYTLIRARIHDLQFGAQMMANRVSLINRILSRVMVASVFIVLWIPWTLLSLIQLNVVHFYYFNLVVYASIGIDPYLYYVRIRKLRNSINQLICHCRFQGQ